MLFFSGYRNPVSFYRCSTLEVVYSRLKLLPSVSDGRFMATYRQHRGIFFRSSAMGSILKVKGGLSSCWDVYEQGSSEAMLLRDEGVPRNTGLLNSGVSRIKRGNNTHSLNITSLSHVPSGRKRFSSLRSPFVFRTLLRCHPHARVPTERPLVNVIAAEHLVSEPSDTLSRGSWT